MSGRQQRKKYVHNSQVGQVIRWHDEVSLPLNTRPPAPSLHRLSIQPFISNEFNVFNEKFNLIMHESTKVSVCACVCVCICEVLNWEPEVQETGSRVTFTTSAKRSLPDIRQHLTWDNVERDYAENRHTHYVVNKRWLELDAAHAVITT